MEQYYFFKDFLIWNLFYYELNYLVSNTYCRLSISKYLFNNNNRLWLEHYNIALG